MTRITSKLAVIRDIVLYNGRLGRYTSFFYLSCGIPVNLGLIQRTFRLAVMQGLLVNIQTAGIWGQTGKVRKYKSGVSHNKRSAIIRNSQKRFP